MKFNIGIWSLFLVSIVSAEASNYLKAVANLTAENKNRYSALHVAMNDLEIDSDSLVCLKEAIEDSLTQSVENVGNVSLTLKEMCQHNEAVQTELSKLPKLKLGSSLSEASKWLKTDEFSNLKTAYDVTYKGATTAYKWAELANKNREILERNSLQIKFMLEMHGIAKKSDLEKEEHDAKSKAALEKVKKFIKDSEHYGDWLHEDSKKLSDIWRSDYYVDVAFKAKHEVDLLMTSLNEIENLYSAKVSDKKKALYVSIEAAYVNEKVEEVSNICKEIAVHG